MPDADKVHAGLGYRHQKVYKQLCEGVLPPREIAYTELNALRQVLKEYGNAPLSLIQQATVFLGLIPTEPLLRQAVNWGEKRRELENLCQQISQKTRGNKRAMMLAEEACKEQLRRIQQDTAPDDLKLESITSYIQKVYEADFEERIPLGRHYNDADPDLVNARLEEMRPGIEEGIDGFAKQLARHGGVSPLRRPRRTKQSIGLYDDLLTAGESA